jgi:hypothetical protein
LSIKSKVVAVAATLTLLGGGGVALAASSQAAVMTLPPSGIDTTVQNTLQTTVGNEAGFYAKSNGHTRFRYVQADIVASATLKNFTGSTTSAGAAGVELCDPTTMQAAQFGLLWNPGDSAWEVRYGTGTFTPPLGGGDVCTIGGLVVPISASTLLDGDGHGNIGTINTGDLLQVSIYWNPNLKHHYLQFEVSDITQDWTTDVAHTGTGFRNWYEAGIGAFSPGDSLTGGAINLAAQFTSAAFNYYSSSKFIGSIVSSHWRTAMAQTVNSSDQVVLSPAFAANASGPVPGSLNGAGTAFSIYSGSTSP